MTTATKRKAPVDADGLYNLGKEIGELIAAVRANNHAVNNLSQRVDAFSNVATVQQTMLEQSRLLVEEVRAIKSDVAALKDRESRRQGASGLITVIIKSPVAAWLAAGLAAAWALVHGFSPR